MEKLFLGKFYSNNINIYKLYLLNKFINLKSVDGKFIISYNENSRNADKPENLKWQKNAYTANARLVRIA